jgi:SRSO17 transposase
MINLANIASQIPDLETFLTAFAPQFWRSETRVSVGHYVRGLLAEVQRKNGWQLAEEIGLSNPHALQRLLNEAKWDAGEVHRQLRAIIMEQIGYDPGVGVLDESGFVKWGEKSAGVARQYCGRLGKVENCQVGVYLAYVAPTGAAFLDTRLYLPKVWTDDRERCRAAQIPDEVTFQTKPEIAQAMLEQAWSEDIPLQWVTGDTLYGNSPGLRQAIHAHNRYYVMEIGSHHQVMLASDQSVKLRDLPDSLAVADWETLCFHLGEKEMLADAWQRQRVLLATDGETIGPQWLLIRRSGHTQSTYRFYISNAPLETALGDLVVVMSSRHHIEDLFGEAKGEMGMADYEVRQWHGWHRHMTLVMLAHTWLKLVQHRQREKKSPALVVDCESGRIAADG